MSASPIGDDAPQPLRQMPTLRITATRWIRVAFDGGPEVLAKTADVEGRRVATRVIVIGNNGLDSTALKSVHLGWLERTINTEPIRGMLALGDVMAEQRDDLAAAIDHHLKDPGQPPETRERQKLTRPDRSDPAAFYRLVADAYNEVTQTTPNVALTLAAEAGVPVATAQRWIWESRRRGFLTPTRRACPARTTTGD